MKTILANGMIRAILLGYRVCIGKGFHGGMKCSIKHSYIWDMLWENVSSNLDANDIGWVMSI
jgi:hypothetical protein